MNTMAAAAAPYVPAWFGCRSPRRPRPAEKKRAAPWIKNPKYRETRRPKRSTVKTLAEVPRMPILLQGSESQDAFPGLKPGVWKRVLA